MVKIQRLFAKTNLKIPVCRIRSANPALQETKNSFLKKRTIYIENPLKSYDFSGFSGPSDWFRTSGLLNPTEAENFFRTFLAIFYRFRSYSVTLVTSYKPPFPPVPRASVVIHVVKNASRSKEREAFSMFKVSAL